MSTKLPPFALALKAYRDREGLTQEAAAERWRMSDRLWERWESATRSPRGDLAAFAAQLLDERA